MYNTYKFDPWEDQMKKTKELSGPTTTFIIICAFLVGMMIEGGAFNVPLSWIGKAMELVFIELPITVIGLFS